MTPLTQAGQLARSLLAIRDRSDRMQAVAGVCEILAAALEDTDAHTPLDEAASNTRAEAMFWSATEAHERRSLAGRYDRLFDPEAV